MCTLATTYCIKLLSEIDCTIEKYLTISLESQIVIFVVRRLYHNMY